jgi:photosystem II PsbH protein
MQNNRFQSKKVAPIQYLLRQLNSDAGSVTPGWGTTGLMAIVMLFFFVFLLLILQIFNASIVLNGINVDWSSLSATSTMNPSSIANSTFTSTASGVFLGLLVFASCCIAFVIYGVTVYPTDPD